MDREIEEALEKTESTVFKIHDILMSLMEE